MMERLADAGAAIEVGALDLPARHRFHVQPPGMDRLVAITIQVDADPSPLTRQPGEWASFNLGPLAIRVKLEA